MLNCCNAHMEQSLRILSSIFVIVTLKTYYEGSMASMDRSSSSSSSSSFICHIIIQGIIIVKCVTRKYEYSSLFRYT